MSIATALLNNLSMSLRNAQAQKAQKAEKAEETQKTERQQRQQSFGALSGVSVNLERNADADTLVNNTKEIYKNSLKASAMLYLVGFAIGFCPGLLFAASLAFLFSGKGLDFKSHLVNSLSQNADAMAKFQNQNNSVEVKAETKADAPKAEETKEAEAVQVQKAEAPQTAEKAAKAPEKAPHLALETRQQPQLALETKEQPLALETKEQPLALETEEQPLTIETKQEPQLALEGQPRLALEMHNNNATNPIVAQKEEQKQMSPLELAQQKYAKAVDSQNEAEALLEKREKAQQIAFEKYDEAKANFDKAKAEYDQANAQIKAQMTEQMTNHQYSVMTRFTNANVAKEEADVAKAKLDQARVLTAIAQREIEDLQAEEIVDVNI